MSKGRFKSNDMGATKDNNKGPYYSRGLANNQYALYGGFSHQAKDSLYINKCKTQNNKKYYIVNIVTETSSDADIKCLLYIK